MCWNQSQNLEVFFEPSGNSNGLTFDKDGNILVCEMQRYPTKQTIIIELNDCMKHLKNGSTVKGG